MWKHLLLVLLTSSAIAGEMRGSANSSSSSSSGATNLTGPVTSVGAATTIVGPIGINGLITSNTGVGVSTTAPIWPLTIISTNTTGTSSEGALANATPALGVVWNQSGTSSFVVRSSTEISSAGTNAIIAAEGVGGQASSSLIMRASSGTFTNRTIYGTADRTYGNVSWQTWTGAAYATVGRIAVLSEGIPASAANMPTYFNILTASTGSASATEKVRVTSSGRLGIGLTPTAKLHLTDANANGVNTSPTGYGIQYSSADAVSTVFGVTGGGHVVSSGTTPSIACNAGSPVMLADSNDMSGEFTGGAASANCTVTFVTAFTKKPRCWCADGTNILSLKPVTTTTTLVCTSATTIGTDNVMYGCQAAP